jgi:hypothetical protein
MADATTLRNFASMFETSSLTIRVFLVPGGPYIKHPFGGWFNAHSFEEFRVGDWQLNGFPKDSELISQTAYVGEIHFSRILIHHIENKRIDFSRNHLHDSLGGLIQSNSCSDHKFASVKFYFDSHNIYSYS